jgi:hypothetical protein
MIKQSEQKHRSEVLQNMQTAINSPAPQPAAQQPADFWFLNGGASGQVNNQAQATQQTTQGLSQAPPEPAYATFNQAMTVAPQMPGGGVQQNSVPVLQDNATAQITQADEQALLKKVHDAQQNYGHRFGNLHTIMPLSQQQAATATDVLPTENQLPQQQPQNTMTTPVDPAIIKLAGNDDLNIDTIARQAQQQVDNNDGEVVISLH